MDLQKENNLIREAFNDEAHSRGFCLDQEWSDCENPYLDGDTNLAFDFFKSGWQAAKAQAIPEGFVLVPKEPTDAMLFAASGRDIVAEHYGDENIMWPELRETWKAMLEAARGGNE